MMRYLLLAFKPALFCLIASLVFTAVSALSHEAGLYSRNFLVLFHLNVTVVALCACPADVNRLPFMESDKNL
jgi:hypothetical protein